MTKPVTKPVTKPQQPTETADTTGTPTDPTTEVHRVEQIDPATLLVDVNVRAETVADKQFVASIQDLGVLQPIRAVRTGDGQLRVEFGHRRTLAAIEAGLATVPVIVVADEQTDTAGQVERIVRQYAENEHRTGLTQADKLGVVKQLSLLKVSAAQIAKRTKMKRPRGRPGSRGHPLRAREGRLRAVRAHVGPGRCRRGVRHRPRHRQGPGRGREDRSVRPRAGPCPPRPRQRRTSRRGRAAAARRRGQGDRGAVVERPGQASRAPGPRR